METGDFTPIVETLEASSPVTIHISHTIIIAWVSFMKFIRKEKQKNQRPRFRTSYIFPSTGRCFLKERRCSSREEVPTLTRIFSTSETHVETV